MSLIYDLTGARGRTMKVYSDKVEISSSDGVSTIFHCDCVGLQFKKAGTQSGYIQLETYAGKMNSTFTYDEAAQSSKIMAEVADYISQQMGYIKAAKVASAIATSASKELQQLLAEGAVGAVDAPFERKYDLASTDKIKAQKGLDFVKSIPGFSKEQLLQRKEELLDKIEVVDRSSVADIRARVAVINNLIAQAVHLERGEITQEEFDAAKEEILKQY